MGSISGLELYSCSKALLGRRSLGCHGGAVLFRLLCDEILRSVFERCARCRGGIGAPVQGLTLEDCIISKKSYKYISYLS
jgi:hypothetical protein